MDADVSDDAPGRLNAREQRNEGLRYRLNSRSASAWLCQIAFATGTDHIGTLARRYSVKTSRTTIPGRSPIEKVGFFQFGHNNKGDPVRSLASCLLEANSTYGPLSNTLIVLPEAFNILNDYLTSSDPAPSVARSLKQISKRVGVAFVVGLIRARVERNKRYSFACLIDGDTYRILSCKTDPDNSPNYQPYPGICDELVLHRGVCIAALICHDAAENPVLGWDWAAKRQRQGALADQIAARRDGAHALLCVPGRMLSVSSVAIAEAWSSRLKELAVIVANGTPNYPSVIRFGEWWACCPEKTENVVCLYPWAALRAKGQDSPAR